MQSPKEAGTLRFVARDQTSAATIRSKPTAIVVERNLSAALPIVSLLSSNEFHVTLADSYLEAKRRLIERPPDLLVTQLALGEYNGLGLIVRGKSHRPHMAAVVVSTFDDPVLQADAEAMGATFIKMPVSDVEFKAAVFRTLLRQPNEDGVLAPIRPPFERRQRQRRRGSLEPVEERRLEDRRTDILAVLGTWPPTKPV